MPKQNDGGSAYRLLLHSKGIFFPFPTTLFYASLDMALRRDGRKMSRIVKNTQEKRREKR